MNMDGLVEAVQRPFAPVSCGMFRIAQCRSTSWIAIDSSAYADHTYNHLPSLLLPWPAPAPGVASFCMPASAPDFGRLRYLAARLMSSSASNTGRSATARESADKRYRKQLDTLVGLQPKTVFPLKVQYGTVNPARARFPLLSGPCKKVASSVIQELPTNTQILRLCRVGLPLLVQLLYKLTPATNSVRAYKSLANALRRTDLSVSINVLLLHRFLPRKPSRCLKAQLQTSYSLSSFGMTLSLMTLGTDLD